MSFERRDFLKAGTFAMATALATPAFALNDDSTAKGKGRLEGGYSSLKLEGQLKTGHMTLEARAFEDGRDRAVIINSTLAGVDLYSSMFSYDHDKSVFSVFRDNDHSTSVFLSNTDDSKTGRLVLWNDSDPPAAFELDKRKFITSENLQDSVRDAKSAVVDVLGKRKPPAFTWRELEAVFGDDRALNEFMRGEKSHHDSPPGDVVDWICRLLSLLPGSTLALAWQAK